MTVSSPSLQDAFLSDFLTKKSPRSRNSYAREVQFDMPQNFTRRSHRGNNDDFREADKDTPFNVPQVHRADSLAQSQMSDAMDVDHQDENVGSMEHLGEEDSIIKCICGYGAGYDDDNCVQCDEPGCGAWQHLLCLFCDDIHQEPQGVPDGDYTCTHCSPRPVDAQAAQTLMTKKLWSLNLLKDRIDELKCEVQQREDELAELDHGRAKLEFNITVNGPLIEAGADLDAYTLLDSWYAEIPLWNADMEKTRQERDGTNRHISMLEDERERLQCNMLTRQAELDRKLSTSTSQPTLYTTACSLGSRAAMPHTLPPILKFKIKIKGGRVEGKGRLEEARGWDSEIPAT